MDDRGLCDKGRLGRGGAFLSASGRGAASSSKMATSDTKSCRKPWAGTTRPKFRSYPAESDADRNTRGSRRFFRRRSRMLKKRDHPEDGVDFEHRGAGVVVSSQAHDLDALQIRKKPASALSGRRQGLDNDRADFQTPRRDGEEDRRRHSSEPNGCCVSTTRITSTRIRPPLAVPHFSVGGRQRVLAIREEFDETVFACAVAVTLFADGSKPGVHSHAQTRNQTSESGALSSR